VKATLEESGRIATQMQLFFLMLFAGTLASCGASRIHSWPTEEKLRWLSPDNAARDSLCETAWVLEVIDARPGQVIADIGAGVGYLTFKLAPKVEPGGKVYATEIEPLPDMIRAYAEKHGVTNVVAMDVSMAAPGLPEAVDTAVMFNLHSFVEVEATRNYFEALRRVIRKDGKVVFFTSNDSNSLPRTSDQLPFKEMASAVAASFRVERTEPFRPGCQPSGPVAPGYLMVLRPL